MDKLIKENLVYLILVIAALGIGIYWDVKQGKTALENYNISVQKNDELKTKEQKLNQLKEQKRQEEEMEKRENTGSGKLILEVLGEQFSPEASFGPLFEFVLANITNSGVKIRSIDYNYSPADDMIYSSNAPGYNVCELLFTTIGTYSQFQNLFKNIVKNKYLTSVNEIYIEPYEPDKTLLIARLKIRLYTKSI